MYLVTGGAGFIGSNLVAALAARGETVVVCDWLGQDARWRNLVHHAIADIIVPEALPDWLQQAGDDVEAVLHMGAVSTTTETDIDRLVRLNIRASLDLFSWCAQHQVRFLYASSAATYGDGSAGFDDDADSEALASLTPLNAYGWSKHVVDRRIVRLAEQDAPLPPQCVGLKFFNVYGPNEYHKGPMASLIARSYPRLAAGEPLRLFRSARADYADGEQLRDFIYVQDCVDALLWLLDRPRVSGLFNLGTGQARSWLDLATALFEAMGLPKRIEFVDLPAELADKYQYFTQARMRRLRDAGYARPFTSLEAGVADYVQRYLSRSDPYC